jgi:hypothetical protein
MMNDMMPGMMWGMGLVWLLKFTEAVRFVGIFVGIGRTNFHDEFRYSRTRELSRCPQERWRERQLEHVDCRAA